MKAVFLIPLALLAQSFVAGAAEKVVLDPSFDRSSLVGFLHLAASPTGKPYSYVDAKKNFIICARPLIGINKNAFFCHFQLEPSYDLKSATAQLYSLMQYARVNASTARYLSKRQESVRYTDPKTGEYVECRYPQFGIEAGRFSCDFRVR